MGWCSCFQVTTSVTDVGEHSLIVSDFNPKMSGMKSSRSLVVLVRIHGDKFG